MSLKEEFLSIRTDTPAVRATAYTVGGVFLGLALLLYISHKDSFPFFSFGGALILAWGLVHPQSFRFFHFVWMALALCMGAVMSRVILFLLFYIAIVPTGLLGRLFKKEFLNLRFGKDTSYWIPKNKRDSSHHHFESQF